MSARHLHADAPTPLEFLQLAGHPLRWRILSELARSDRIVHELTELVGEPQNLVSYHLGKLRDGNLVSARRSSADRRDAYYSANLAQIGAGLSASGGTLHPALRMTAPARSDTPIDFQRILFLCTGNSARSLMAEALVRARLGRAVEVVSAGSHPKPVHPNAVRVMREEHGLDLSGYTSKHLDQFANQHFDWVISLCDRVREICPRFPGHPRTIHWSIPNPATGDSDRATYPLFRQTAAALAARVDFLVTELTDLITAPRNQKKKS